MKEEEVIYEFVPPTSGPHFKDRIAEWGFHKKSIPYSTLVHNLEHGEVVIYYSLDKKLEAQKNYHRLVEQFGEEGIVFNPSEELDSSYILTAWRHTLIMDEDNEHIINMFTKKYRINKHY